MKWFYIVAILGTTGLFAAPYWLVKHQNMDMVEKAVPDFDAQPRRPIMLYDSYSSRVNSMDPATCGDTTSAGVQANFYEGLYTYHYLKRPVEIVPQLAADIPQVSEDGLTWTIPLKRGVLYRRNEAFGYDVVGIDRKGKEIRQYRTREVTADDFVLAFKRVADYHIATPLSYSLIEGYIEGMSDYRAQTRGYRPGDFSRYDKDKDKEKEPIAGVKALDAYTLQITLTEPYPQFLYVLAMAVYAPVPREVIDYWLATEPQGDGRAPVPIHRRNPEIKDWRATVGTGPFYLADYSDGGRIVWVRNQDFRPEYYPTEGGPGDAEAGLLDDAGKRVPFIDAIYWTYVPESNPSWMLFMTKQHDVNGIPPDQYNKVITGVGRTLSPEMKKQGIKLLTYTQPSIYYLAFNMDDKVVGRSPSLRKAMSLAYNVQESIDVLRNGRGVWCRSILPAELAERQAVGDSPYARFDLDKAKEYLKKARVELGLGPNDPLPKISIDYPSSSQLARRQAEIYKSHFKELGVDIQIELMTWPTFLDKLHRGQMQIAAGSGWHADYPDAQNFLQLFYGPNIESGTNSTRYKNAEYDALYEQMARMPMGPERTEIIKNMVAILNADCPVIYDSEPEAFLLMHSWMHNYKPHPVGYGYTKYYRIDEQARRKDGGR
ncbi:MAG: ABC transporter substrate-binding protein [Phycisphaerae bacterium]|nr:ABC transporter substrate-binding protein [Phycisphaerae bacterium]